MLSITKNSESSCNSGFNRKKNRPSSPTKTLFRGVVGSIPPRSPTTVKAQLVVVPTTTAIVPCTKHKLTNNLRKSKSGSQTLFTPYAKTAITKVYSQDGNNEPSVFPKPQSSPDASPDSPSDPTQLPFSSESRISSHCVPQRVEENDSLSALKLSVSRLSPSSEVSGTAETQEPPELLSSHAHVSCKL